MKTRLTILAVAFLIGIAALAGNENDSDKSDKDRTPAKNNISVVQGQVMDLSSGESITGAEVKIKQSDKKTYTDFDGQFSFQNIEPGNYDIVVSYISYDNSLLENIEIEQGHTEKISIKLVNAK